MRNLFLIQLIILFPFICLAQPEFITNIPVNSSNFTNLNGTLFFTSGDSLFLSDGTSQGTKLIKAGILNPSNLTNINDTLFFVADKICSPKCTYRQLWKSDGTENGTILIKKFQAVYILKNIGSRIFLAANDSIHGAELWITNGTPEGTVMVKDINPGEANSIIPYFHYDVTDEKCIDHDIKENEIFFIATDGINGEKIWKSNGSETETMMLNPSYTYTSDIVAHADTVTFEGPENITNVNGVIYYSTGFAEQSGSHAPFLCKTDGTSEGTEVIKAIYCDEGLDYFYPAGDLLYFRVNHSSVDGLWRSDGTAQGTFGLAAISESCFACPIMASQNYFIYSGCYQENSIGIWKTDGINTPTRAIDINCTFDAGCSHALKVGKYFFYTDDAFYENNCIWKKKYKQELWQSDLTPEGRKIVKDMFNTDDTTYAMSADLTNVNEVLYFTTREVIDDYNNLGVKRLWKYDPSTYVVSSLNDPKQVHRFLVYPNPAANEVIIESPWSSAYTFNMIDAYGKQIRSFESDGEKTTVDLKDLQMSEGIYFLKISSAESIQIIKILVK